jgi:hypothetical protein
LQASKVTDRAAGARVRVAAPAGWRTRDHELHARDQGPRRPARPHHETPRRNYDKLRCFRSRSPSDNHVRKTTLDGALVGEAFLAEDFAADDDDRYS